ncbi:hypothetical protein OVY48_22435 [Sphingobium sp. SA2]|uniref:hypothetical protein n=1 Tax=Sphingobium sp. SA2 TaxID=1524832 RepID=UPI0028C1D42F|nr:hypothetical protein [Sphingobium sp. SA2]MDT7536157.1 hypothetical protein [Sphingobium sp. SA2]
MASNASQVTRHRLRHDQPWRRKRDRRRIVPVGSFESMLAVIPSLPRQSLARLVQQAIDRMDDLDGDPDLGPDGDELEGSRGEDDFHRQNADWQGYAGCPVADLEKDNTIDRCLAGDGGCAQIGINGVRYWRYEREPE